VLLARLIHSDRVAAAAARRRETEMTMRTRRVAAMLMIRESDGDGIQETRNPCLMEGWTINSIAGVLLL
jgi:hypothetical protein